MAQTITADELILVSPDGTKECRIKLENDGFLYKRDGNGQESTITNITRDNDEPQYD